MARAHPLRLSEELIGGARPSGLLARLLIVAIKRAVDPGRVGRAACFGGHPGHLRSRVCRGLEPERRPIGLAEVAGNDLARLVPVAFESAGLAITLAAVHQPHRRQRQPTVRAIGRAGTPSEARTLRP